MATLMVTPFTPRATNGRGLRTVCLVRAIARFDDVDVAYVEFDGQDPAEELYEDAHVALERLESTRGLNRAVTYAQARKAGVPKGFARGVSPELVQRFRTSASYDRVVADGPTAGAAALLLARAPHVIYNAQNLESSFRSTLSDNQSGTPRELEEFERSLLRSASESWLPTGRDMAGAERLSPEASLRYVPNVIDVEGIRPVRPQGRNRVLFIADHTYEPNRNAARFLLDEVMPLLWRTTPEATLVLVGRGIEQGASDPRIDVLGFVDDVEDAYRSADCAVVPLLQGGGSPLKLIEAMAYGLPIVASTIAVRGIDGAVAGTHFVLADDASATSAALESTLRGENDHLGAAARALVSQRYSIESLAELVRDRRSDRT